MKVPASNRTIARSNHIGRLTRLEFQPQPGSGVIARQGAQIIRVPAGSNIRNVTLQGGASHKSAWAVLRGAVLKGGFGRAKPIEIDGGEEGFVIPTGFTLMDLADLEFTINKRNQGKEIPFEAVSQLGPEEFYLIHASYCHPDQLFLAQGTFTSATFSESFDLSGQEGFENWILQIKEELLPAAKAPFDLLIESGLKAEAIIVSLREGGQITLREEPAAAQ